MTLQDRLRALRGNYFGEFGNIIMRQEVIDELDRLTAENEALRKAPEVRLDGEALDELVGTGHFHLENMDANVWWMELRNEAGGVAVWLRARGKITAHFERRK